MQHGGEPYSRTEVLGVGRDGDQGFGGGFEQQVIDDRFVVIGDVGDRPRQGEDDKKIGHRQQLGSASAPQMTPITEMFLTRIRLAGTAWMRPEAKPMTSIRASQFTARSAWSNASPPTGSQTTSAPLPPVSSRTRSRMLSLR